MTTRLERNRTLHRALFTRAPGTRHAFVAQAPMPPICELGEKIDEFCLPELIELSNTFGGVGLHCCANAQHQFAQYGERSTVAQHRPSRLKETQKGLKNVFFEKTCDHGH